MATYTDNYNLVKPTMAESADIRTINGNMDSVDNIMHATQVSLAPAYDQNETYNTGDIVMYEFLMYECLDDEVTGAWDATKWQRTTAGEHGGGGGGSDVEITPTLQSGTKIADFEIDGVSGALYAPSGGGGGGGGSSQNIADVLWSGAETPTYPTTYTATLTHSYSDYDFIVFDGTETDDSYQMQYVLNVSDIVENEKYVQAGDENSGFVITFLDDTSIKLEAYQSSHATTYTKITGLKICGTLAPMIYSTEEREVGAWKNDKPLYQKTFTGTISSTSFYIPNTTDMEEVAAISGYVSDGSYKYNIPYRDTSDYTSVGFDSNGVRLITSNYFSGGAFVLTVQYTKTSDVAGSGSYGSLGVPMEHYDSTERVAGTYFGDTLYKKTIRQTNIDGSPSDWTLIETMSGVSEYVKSEVKFLNSSSNKTFSQYYISISFNNSTKGLYYYIREMGSGVRGDLEVTVYYTKSTT